MSIACNNKSSFVNGEMMRHEILSKQSKKNKAAASSIAAVAGAISLMGHTAHAQGIVEGYQEVPAGDFVVTYNADGSATLTSATQTLQLTAGEFKVIDGVLYVQDQIAAGGVIGAAAGVPIAEAAMIGGLAVVGGAALMGGASSGGAGTTAPANSAPTVANAIADQSVAAGSPVSIIVPANTFADADSDLLSYTATFADGSALSTRGLSFDATTHVISGTLTGAGSATINVTANDGRGGVVTDAFVLTQEAATIIVTDPGALILAENAGANAAVFTATANEPVTSWSLTGPDAGLFSISSTGVVTANGSLDHEAATDANHDGAYTFTVNATSGTGTGSHVVTVAVTDVTELPDWLANATEYGIGYTAPASLTAPDEVASNGVHTLLDSDADNGVGNESHWDGNGIYNQATALSFGFVDAGGVLEPSDGNLVTMNESYTDVERSFIRSVFEHFSNVSNLTFTEETGAAAANADLRMGRGTWEHLGVSESTLGFAFQPSGDNPRGEALLGDFFLVSNAQGLTQLSNPFETPYGDERNTISHELGHALGLDHPFADRESGAGFEPITGTADTHANYTNDSTGGGYQSQLTDNVMETIMAYYNPFAQTADMGSTSLTNTPWQLSINDIAALQHLYGANLNYATGDDTYTFNSDTQVFSTIWDGGGTDTIVQTGDRSAYIDMNEGSYSRVGFLGGRTYTFTPDDLGVTGTTFDSVSLVEARDGIVVLSADGSSFTYTTDLSVGGLDDDLGFNVVVNGTAHNNVGGFSGFAIDHTNTGFNLGIAFGVTIENATGGAGSDTIVGNSAANVIIGGAGNDVLTGGAGGDTFGFAAGFGEDRITDFTSGQDVLRFEGFSSLAGSSVIGGNTVLDLGMGNSVTLAGISHGLTAGTDYVFA